MKLICFFDKNAAGNPYFIYIFNAIFEKIKTKYPKYDISHSDPINGGIGESVSFKIINPHNNKMILMSFGDRGMDFLNNISGYEKYSIVQYIGGIGMFLNSKLIKEKYNIEHIPFQYPLGMPNSYDYINEIKSVYNPDKKIKKAIFIGSIYGIRQEFHNIMKTHPLIEIINSNENYYHRKEYYKKISEYALSLSFNGNGEVCMRDFESMGLNIPVVRSELLTQFYNLLAPDIHYIRGSVPCSDACYNYSGINHTEIAEQFMYTIEISINDYDKLTYISNNGSEYFEKYCKPDYMVDLFCEISNINKIL